MIDNYDRQLRRFINNVSKENIQPQQQKQGENHYYCRLVACSFRVFVVVVAICSMFFFSYILQYNVDSYLILLQSVNYLYMLVEREQQQQQQQVVIIQERTWAFCMWLCAFKRIEKKGETKNVCWMHLFIVQMKLIDMCILTRIKTITSQLHTNNTK